MFTFPRFEKFIGAMGLTIALLGSHSHGLAVVTGSLKLWYPVTITWDGPNGAEDAVTFRNNRLDVTFTNGTKTFKVPGYFAADGNAGETGATAGNKWRVKFTPDMVGKWDYTATFKTGTDIAASKDGAGGVDLPTPLVGATGSFVVLPMDGTATGFFKKGNLLYVGASYPQFEGTKEWFVKGGSGSPENFMGYVDFDGTSDLGNMSPATPSKLHEWPTHVAEWTTGDPTWKNGTKGKAIIGAINYLASKGANTQYIVVTNVKGDGQDSWLWNSPTVKDVYDVSKLDQWDIVFTYMDAKGINKHILMWEAENSGYLGSTMTPERMIYDRELVARFGHCLGIMWDFSEEPTVSSAMVGTDVANMYAIDPYHHVTGSHCMMNTTSLYSDNYGKPGFHAAFLQANNYANVATVVKGSIAKPDRMIVSVDEGAAIGIGPGGGSKVHNDFWSVLMNGGYGHEAYYGYGGNVGDCDDDNFHAREASWTMYGISTKFFMDYRVNHFLGLGNGMVASAGLLANTSTPTDAGFVAYPATATVNTAGATGPLEVWFYNTTTGGELVRGATATVTGGGSVSIGAPPAGAGPWAALVAAHVEPGVVGVANKNKSASGSNLIAFATPKGSIEIVYSLVDRSTVTVEAFSASGKKIATLLDNAKQGVGQQSLSIPGFQSANANVWVRVKMSSASGNREFSTRVIR